ncbi:MAG: Maf family protein [Desulfobulbaceae bacterium]|jgi:septum formation protein|nr:Maf family protein [Desulfobulbaceae bacterium]
MAHFPSPFKTSKDLILASGSPRRQEFFRQLGLRFQVICCELDETPLAEESPQTYVARLALAKAHGVAREYPDAVVVGADTSVVFENEILGKPRDARHGLQMLRQLRGAAHEVVTGFAVVHGDKQQVQTVTSIVRFHDFTDAVLQAYVASGDGSDKAGGYGMQSGGAFLVREITGSFSNVIGLPMTELVQMLLGFEAIEPSCTS